MTARRGLVWPVLLIGLGIVFLLANFGYIGPVSVVTLFRLWPLVLVLVGIEIALGRRWPLPALAAEVAVVALGLALVVAQPLLPAALSFGAIDGGESSVAVPRGDERALSLRISGGAATYDLAGGGSDLVRVDSDREDLRLRRDLREGERREVRIDQGANASGFRIGPASAGRVSVRIASDVATSLRLDAGAGEFAIDLSKVRLTDADINVGAASLRLTVPTPSGDVPISVSAGASSLVIEVPAGVEARVTTTGGLLSTRFENARFTGSETAGYAAARDRVTIRVSAGASSVVVR